MSLTSDDKMIALIGSVETEINDKEYSNCTILDIDPIIVRKLFFDRKKISFQMSEIDLCINFNATRTNKRRFRYTNAMLTWQTP